MKAGHGRRHILPADAAIVIESRIVFKNLLASSQVKVCGDREAGKAVVQPEKGSLVVKDRRTFDNLVPLPEILVT
ncbi:hypothetical protein ACFLU6_13665 [Acidobacteriota bacterium]